MNENELIRRAQNGDANAFNTLLGTYEGRLYSLCLRYMRNAQDAQDCLQDAMLKIYKCIGSFAGNSSIYTWLYRVTGSVCLDALRARKRAVSVSLDDMKDNGWSPSTAPEDAPDSKMVKSQQREALIKLIKELPENMRDAIIYREVYQMSYEEVAEKMDVDVGTIKSRISRARQKLRERIRGDRELFELASVKGV